MNLVSKKWFLNLLTRLVVIVIVAKMLALGLLWFLPGEGVSFQKEQSTLPNYSRYAFGTTSAKTVTEQAVQTVGSGNTLELSALVLKGLYRTQTGGYVIIAKKSNIKASEVIGIHESYSGYKLLQINLDSALFERGGKQYTLYLEQKRPVAPAIVKEPQNIPGEPLKVTRNEVSYYTKNFDQIWRDIAIREVREGNEITGFKVTRIRKGSPFAKLGLQRGDVIIKANNKRLKSYADAMAIYQKIDTLKALEIVILRKNQEKELVYEIH